MPAEGGVANNLSSALKTGYVLAAVVLVGMIALGLLLWKGSNKNRPAAAPVTGTVRLDAAPYALIKEIRGEATGKTVSLEDRETPLNIALPPGDYRFVLSHPKFPDAFLKVHVDPGSATAYKHTFTKVDPEEILKAYE